MAGIALTWGNNTCIYLALGFCEQAFELFLRAREILVHYWHSY